MPSSNVNQASKKCATDHQSNNGVTIMFVFSSAQRSDNSTRDEYACKHVCKTPTYCELLPTEEPCCRFAEEHRWGGTER